MYASEDLLQRTHSSLLAVIPAPELQSALTEAGLTTLPGLPLSFPSHAPAWQHFKKSIQRFWSVLRLACTAQQALAKAEWIHTCV